MGAAADPQAQPSTRGDLARRKRQDSEASGQSSVRHRVLSGTTSPALSTARAEREVTFSTASNLHGDDAASSDNDGELDSDHAPLLGPGRSRPRNGRGKDAKRSEKPVEPDASAGEGGGQEPQKEPTFMMRYGNAVIIGIINVVILLPVVVAYAQIIFSDAFFKPYLEVLIKLVFFSSLVHQLCFTLMSSLPFAIGQVQDAGLIFLSSMATKIVTQLQESDAPDEDVSWFRVDGVGEQTER